MLPVPGSGGRTLVTTHEIEVVTPYRLDLTVSALRRTAANPVDVYTADGRYLRALPGFPQPVVVSVTQPRADALAVSVRGAGRGTELALASVRRILGTERDVSEFDRQARAISWLAPLAIRMRGLKPPRYPDLFEACANAIVFQQLSLHAASAIMRRLLLDLGTSVDCEGVALRTFPSAERFLGADDAEIRATGLSTRKAAALRAAGEAVASGALREATLEERSSADAALLLRRIRGIGPWTAAVILLRGLGRLDTFPGNDSSVVANLALVAGRGVEAGPAIERLGQQRGMLYFCLLLARLESRGQIGRASDGAG